MARGLLQRLPEAASPGDILAVADVQQQAEFLREQYVIIGRVVAEQRERLDERAASGDDFGPAAADHVQAGEVLIHPDRISHPEQSGRAGDPDPRGPGRGCCQDHGRSRGEEIGTVVLAEREDIQAQLVGQLRVAEDLTHPVHRPLWTSGALVPLQVAKRKDAKFH